MSFEDSHYGREVQMRVASKIVQAHLTAEEGHLRIEKHTLQLFGVIVQCMPHATNCFRYVARLCFSDELRCEVTMRVLYEKSQKCGAGKSIACFPPRTARSDSPVTAPTTTMYTLYACQRTWKENAKSMRYVVAKTVSEMCVWPRYCDGAVKASYA